MEDRTMIAIVVIVGVVALMMHAGHISATVSGLNKPAPAVSAPVADGANQPSTTGLTGSAVAGGNVQTFNLKANGGQYDPATIEVKKGTIVRIEGDPQTLSGCMEVVNIQGYDISKRISAGDNVIEFPANKVGTFPMYCNMGIGNGKLVVDG